MGTYQSKYTGEQIDNLLGQVENGGGSGGAVTKTTLWEGDLTTSGDVTLNDSIDNYDFIFVKCSATVNNATDSVNASALIDVSSMVYGSSDYMVSIISGTSSSKYSIHFRFEDNLTLKLIASGTTGWASPSINKVIGIKL